MLHPPEPLPTPGRRMPEAFLLFLLENSRTEARELGPEEALQRNKPVTGGSEGGLAAAV